MAKLLSILCFASILISAHGLDIRTSQPSQLPVVDLGYGIYQASFNFTGNYYNFSNIRYAEPPVGQLRFAAPVPPRGRNETVDDGSIARICPQAYPKIAVINQIFVSRYSLTGDTDLEGIQDATRDFDYPSTIPQDPRATEDCLFLDVMVPRGVFDNRDSRPNGAGKGAAVMVWLFEGGFGAGSKYDTPPAGLISRSQIGHGEGIIYVALNYRLGAFGWLSGPSFAVSGTPNAGLYDQRLALTWVKDNIHLFGGDPQRVTVFGQSAGGGSIVHQITAFGGERGGAPFQRAILESPGYIPTTGNYEQEENFQNFLSLLNVSTLDEARRLPSHALQAVSEYQVRNSRNGSWTYGTSVDGLFVPETPSLLLLHGRFDHSVDIMVGHNGDEGLGYPMLQDDGAFESYIRSSYPNAPDAVLDHITQVLYPPTLENKGDVLEDYNPNTSKSLLVTGYTTPLGRQTLLTSESVINCLTYYINKAFRGQTYSYIFNTPPALHGQELYYVFYNEQATDVFFRPINVTLAHIMQDYWINFARFGNPNGEGLPHFPMWNNGAVLQGLSLADVGPIRDPIDGERCGWWQLGLYL